MPTTLDREPADMATAPASPTPETYSISWLADYFLRSPSWVKQRKNDLQEIWYWCIEDLFTESGSLTNKGFECLQDLFDKTANSKILTSLHGRRQSKTKKPEMTPTAYREYIWAKHRKPAPDRDSVIDPDLASSQDASQDIEVVTAEFTSTDTGSEIAENTALVKHELGLTVSENRQTFQGGLSQFKQALKQKIKQELSPVAQEALAEVYAEITDELTAEMPEAPQQKVVKKTRKK